MRGSLGTGVAVLARAAGSLVVNKLVATLAPAGGLTLLAQFQNLMALLTTLPYDGVQVGLVKYLAPLRPGSPRYRTWLGAATALNAAALLLGGVVLALRRQLDWGSLLIFMVGIGLITGQAMLGSSLLAAGRLRAYIGLTVALAALSTAATAAALWAKWPLPRVLLAYLLAQGLTLLPALVLAARAGLLQGLQLRAPISRVALRRLGQFLLMAVSTLLFGKAVDYVLRDYLLATFGPARTDLWQAVAKLSDNYTMVFSAVMGSVFYPRLAALAGQPRAAREYLRGVLLLLAPVLAAGLGLIYACRAWLLPLLFAPRLLGAQALLGPQLLGDWAKLLSWLFIFQLTARARTGAYIAVQAASAVVFAGLLGWLLPRYGLQGAVLAHAARYGLLLACCGWMHYWANSRK
ncbi:O-antigen translocase [Hymenobacter glaciei]|uniref:O-antigen translocase n=1 Tax=Hymenobacter glaciei TaxID=877209 RepID=A0ABP7UE82_9BACT